MVELRPTVPSDAAALFPLITDPRVTGLLLYDGPNSPEEFNAQIQALADESDAGRKPLFTILIDGQPAGTIGIRPYTDGFRADIGLWIGSRYQGRGAGTEAIRLTCDYAFHSFPLDKIEAFIFTGNLVSRRAFEKNGFHLEGTVRHAVRKCGACRDEWIFGLLRDEWAAAAPRP